MDCHNVDDINRGKHSRVSAKIIEQVIAGRCTLKDSCGNLPFGFCGTWHSPKVGPNVVFRRGFHRDFTQKLTSKWRFVGLHLLTIVVHSTK